MEPSYVRSGGRLRGRGGRGARPGGSRSRVVERQLDLEETSLRTCKRCTLLRRYAASIAPFAASLAQQQLNLLYVASDQSLRRALSEGRAPEARLERCVGAASTTAMRAVGAYAARLASLSPDTLADADSGPLGLYLRPAAPLVHLLGPPEAAMGRRSWHCTSCLQTPPSLSLLRRTTPPPSQRQRPSCWSSSRRRVTRRRVLQQRFIPSHPLKTRVFYLWRCWPLCE